MRFEGSQVKPPPLSRRKMMPPTPLQDSYSSFEEEQGHFEVEDQIWSARDRTVIARTKQYLEESKSLKVEVEELESLLGADDPDVDFRRILELNAQREELRTVQLTWQQNSSSSTSGRQWEPGLEEQRVAWSSSERKVIEAVEDYLDRCAVIPSGPKDS